MSARFTDQVVLITGASTGLGLATARAFLNEGARVILAASDTNRLQQAAATLGPNATAIPCDVTNRDQVVHLIADTIRQFQRLDILINNAGTGMLSPLDQATSADIAALLDTNFHGTVHCIQAALPHMTTGARVINISSLAGLRGIPGSSVYSASKAAIVALSEALRIELRDRGITVTVVCPGRIRLTDTGFFDTAKKTANTSLLPVAEELTADQVAAAILDATAKHKKLIVLPREAKLLHLIQRFSPRLADNILAKRQP